MELNKIYNEDCLKGMRNIPDKSIDLTLTDIPYDGVNRESNGLRNLDKGDADIATFNLRELTQLICDKTKGSVYMFCGWEQLSEIVTIMKENEMSTRIVVWEKTNPSPMNGTNIWLSGVELCVFGKFGGGTFNKFCKNSVLRYPNGDNKIHPTQKPLNLFRELVQTSSNEGDLVLDPFMGSGTTAVACIREKRNFIGFEKSEEYWRKSMERIKMEKQQLTLEFTYE